MNTTPADVAEGHRQVAQAFLEVFGPPSDRTKAQRMVMAELHAIGFSNVPVTTNAVVSSGMIDPIRLAVNSGKQEVVFHIQNRIFSAIRDGEEPRPKQTVKR
jgi:hypothetical protein